MINLLVLVLSLSLSAVAYAAPSEGDVYQFDASGLPKAVSELDGQIFNLENDLDNLLLQDNDRLIQPIEDSRHLWSGAYIAGYVAENGGGGAGTSKSTIKLLTADEILTRDDLVLGGVIINNADSARLITLPGVVEGDTGRILNGYAKAITICPNSADNFIINGVAIAPGYSISTTGAVTDMLDMVAINSSSIRADGTGWTSDGNDTACTGTPSSSWPTLPTIGTTIAVDTGGTGDYTTLSAAEAALPSTFTGNVLITLASTDGNADTTPVEFYGFDTDAYELFVIPVDTSLHNGKWDDTIYRLVTTGNAISLYANDITLRGIQVSAGSNDIAIRLRNGRHNLTVDSCILKDSQYGTTLEGAAVADAGHLISNNIIYNTTLSGIKLSNDTVWTATNYIINNTIYNANTDSSAWAGGIRARNNDETVIRNNIIIGSGNYDFFECATKDHNVSSDASATGAGSVTGQTSVLVDFVSVATGSEDLHIQSGSSAESIGADESIRITWDIDGDSRATPFDAGADQL